MLGWNDGTEQEIFSLEELIENFQLKECIQAAQNLILKKQNGSIMNGLKRLDVESWQPEVKKIFEEKGIVIDDENKFEKILHLVKDRAHFLPIFGSRVNYFFVTPQKIDSASILPNGMNDKNLFFNELIRTYSAV